MYVGTVCRRILLPLIVFFTSNSFRLVLPGRIQFLFVLIPMYVYILMGDASPAAWSLTVVVVIIVAKSRNGGGGAFLVAITVAMAFAAATVVSRFPAGCCVDDFASRPLASVFIQPLISFVYQLVILQSSRAPDWGSPMPSSQQLLCSSAAAIFFKALSRASRGSGRMPQLSFLVLNET